MNAGRELDAIVAEKVMEWQEVRDRQGIVGGVLPAPSLRSAFAYWQVVPRYSTDIAAAWEVVERLQLEHLVRLSDCVLDGEAAWICALDSDDLGTAALTAPHAICLAALAAVGAEVPT